MKITGLRIDSVTNDEQIVELEYDIIKQTDNRQIFQLIGGPTGYESFYIDDYAEENMPMFGWLACAGTQNRWDNLFIPAEEMKKAFDKLKRSNNGHI